MQNRIEIVKLPDGRQYVALNGTPLVGQVHLSVMRDQNQVVTWADIRIYTPEFIDGHGPRHPNPHPWVQQFQNNQGKPS